MTLFDRRSLMRMGCLAGAAVLSTAEASGAECTNGAATRHPSSHGLHHVTIRVRDWDRTLHFYQDVLGCTVKMAWEESTGTLDERLSQSSPRNQRWAYLDSGNGAYIEIFEDPGFVPPPPAESDPVRNPGGAVVHFGLRTAQIDAVVHRARARGETVLGEPTDYTLHTTTGQGPVVVRLCFLQGPNGEFIELLQNSP